MKTAILVSGTGTNLQSFIDQVADKRLDLDIVLVFSNRKDACGLTRANSAGIQTACIEHGAYEDRELFDRAVAAKLDESESELIILAGYMRILSPWFVRHFEGRILNIHPALLPLYPGLNTHVRVLEAGDAQHGSTVHFVTEELDGGPGILAGRIGVKPGESADELQARVLTVEHQIYPQAAQLFAEERVSLKNGKAYMDGNLLSNPVVVDFS